MKESEKSLIAILRGKLSDFEIQARLRQLPLKDYDNRLEIVARQFIEEQDFINKTEYDTDFYHLRVVLKSASVEEIRDTLDSLGSVQDRLFIAMKLLLRKKKKTSCMKNLGFFKNEMNNDSLSSENMLLDHDMQESRNDLNIALENELSPAHDTHSSGTPEIDSCLEFNDNFEQLVNDMEMRSEVKNESESYSSTHNKNLVNSPRLEEETSNSVSTSESTQNSSLENSLNSPDSNATDCNVLNSPTLQETRNSVSPSESTRNNRLENNLSSPDYNATECNLVSPESSSHGSECVPTKLTFTRVGKSNDMYRIKLGIKPSGTLEPNIVFTNNVKPTELISDNRNATSAQANTMMMLDDQSIHKKKTFPSHVRTINNTLPSNEGSGTILDRLSVAPSKRGATFETFPMRPEYTMDSLIPKTSDNTYSSNSQNSNVDNILTFGQDTRPKKRHLPETVVRPTAEENITLDQALNMSIDLQASLDVNQNRGIGKRRRSNIPVPVYWNTNASESIILDDSVSEDSVIIVEPQTKEPTQAYLPQEGLIPIPSTSLQSQTTVANGHSVTNTINVIQDVNASQQTTVGHSLRNGHNVPPVINPPQLETTVENGLNLRKRNIGVDSIVPIPSTSSAVPTVPSAAPSTSTAVPSTNSEPKVIDQKLFYKVIELFPNACPDYIKSLCEGRTCNDVHFDDIVNIICSTPDYPQRIEKAPTPDVEINTEEQFLMLQATLPECDPTFLRLMLDKYANDQVGLQTFLDDATSKKITYPSKKDYLKKKQISAQQKQYTTEFDVEKFIEIFPDPVQTFEDPNRKGTAMQAFDYLYLKNFLRNTFRRMSVRVIDACLKSHKEKPLFAMIQYLEGEQARGNVIKTTRYIVPNNDTIQNIPLLQEMAYFSHKTDILKHIETKKKEEEEARQNAREMGLLQECQCCYDGEVMPNDIFECQKGCRFCKDCVKKSTEVILGDSKVDFPCLAACGAEFSMLTLQNALPPKMFSILGQKKAAADIAAAGIEDLEKCPFCDFASIPAPGDKLFRCLNPDCMKESCRECKEPSHVPLKCEEVEKDEDVKARTTIENKMTEALIRECWRCRKKFIKLEGCNKMTCTCGATMCYVCRQPVKDYKHFNGQGGNRTDLCPLYSDNFSVNEQNVLKAAEEAKKEVGVTSLKVDPTADLKNHFERGKKEHEKYLAQQERIRRENERLLQMQQQQHQHHHHHHIQVLQRDIQQRFQAMMQQMEPELPLPQVPPQRDNQQLLGVRRVEMQQNVLHVPHQRDNQQLQGGRRVEMQQNVLDVPYQRDNQQLQGVEMRQNVLHVPHQQQIREVALALAAVRRNRHAEQQRRDRHRHDRH